MASTNKYRLVNYTDVWGNEKDGYEVNNLCIEADDIQMTEDATNKDIAKYLVTCGFLTTSDLRQILIDDYGEMIFIYQRKGMYPLGRLEKIY